MSVVGPMPSPAPLSFLDFDPAPLLRPASPYGAPSSSKSPFATPRRSASLRRSSSVIALPAYEQSPPTRYAAEPSPDYLYSVRRSSSSSALCASPPPRTHRVAVGRPTPSQTTPLPAWTPSFGTSPRPAPSPPTSKPHHHSKPPGPHPRRNPTSRFLPPRERYPKARAEPDLYRTALLRRMNGTPEGRAMLHMGVRLAVSMLEATRALEGLVAAQTDASEGDEDDGSAELVAVHSAERVLAGSWVDVPLDDGSWEIIDEPNRTA